jgi:hypothetical protein
MAPFPRIVERATFLIIGVFIGASPLLIVDAPRAWQLRTANTRLEAMITERVELNKRLAAALVDAKEARQKLAECLGEK